MALASFPGVRKALAEHLPPVIVTNTRAGLSSVFKTGRVKDLPTPDTPKN